MNKLADGSGREKPDKKRVGILFGGQSGEHEVSLSSAQGIMRAIDKEKYEVVPIGICKDGRWIGGQDPMQALATGNGLESALTIVLELERGGGRQVGAGDLCLQELDVIFPVLHGPYGEDGTVQGFLDLLGIPYVGAGVTASAVAMDKVIAKDVFSAHALPNLASRSFGRKTWEQGPDLVAAECEAALRYPVFVKPANMGSSVGVSKANNRQELLAGLEEAAGFDQKLLVEQGVEGREIEVSVLGNDDPIASVPGEIIPCREFYSYAAKYLDNASELLVPAPLSDEQTRQIQELAVKAYEAIGCQGMARVDFLVEKENGEIWLNELNTIPGFTPISMYPKLWEASGIGYSDLIDWLIQLAIQRHADRSRGAMSFDVSRAT